MLLFLLQHSYNLRASQSLEEKINLTPTSHQTQKDYNMNHRSECKAKTIMYQEKIG